MGWIVAFGTGCLVGSRVGGEDFDDVVESVRAIRASQEFQDLVLVLRSHAGHLLRSLADTVDGSSVVPERAEDLVDRVTQLTRRH